MYDKQLTHQQWLQDHTQKYQKRTVKEEMDKNSTISEIQYAKEYTLDDLS